MARINVSFKNNEKEQKLFKDIKENSSDCSSFMKEAARFYLDHVKKKSLHTEPKIVEEADDSIMNILV